MKTNTFVNLESDELNQDEQRQARDLLFQEKLNRRKTGGKVLDFPITPSFPPINGEIGSIDPTGINEGTLTKQRDRKTITRFSSTKTYTKDAIRSRLKSSAVNVVGAKHMGTIMALLLSLAVFKDTMDILSVSLLSWIDWIFDLGMWVLFLFAFEKAPKSIRAELRMISTIAALMEFVPFLDILTTWTFMVLYAWARTHATAAAAFQKTAAGFNAQDATTNDAKTHTASINRKKAA